MTHASLTALAFATTCALAPLGCASSAPPAPATSEAGTGAGHGEGMHGKGMHGEGMHGEGMHHDGASCPMMVAGTTVTAEDVEGGVALTFKTSGDVAALRTHVAAMASKHTSMHAGPAAADAPMKMPPSEARAEDVDGGARIVLTAKNAADVPALRAHARKHAEMMQAGKCPMMDGEKTTEAAPKTP